MTDQEVKDWSPFFDKVYSDANYFLKQQKAHWNRQRPFLVDHELTPCVPKDTTPSYPSGHSTVAHLYALILEDMEPQVADVIETRAVVIAEDRVVGGVHFPTDVEAGRPLAIKIYTALKASPQFRADLEKLKH